MQGGRRTDRWINGVCKICYDMQGEAFYGRRVRGVDIGLALGVERMYITVGQFELGKQRGLSHMRTTMLLRNDSLYKPIA